MTVAALALAAQASLAPCTIPDVPGEARCGTYRVWEDRGAKAGRQIDLKVVVLPATGEPRQPEPLFLIQGGPGQGVTQLAPFYSRAFADVHRTRDLVFVDVRGTGGSHPLTCPELSEPGPRGELDDGLLSADAVRRCRTRLEAHADLRHYTTEAAVGDLDEVRAALGYDRIAIYGTSYGTRVAFVYMRRFPDRVRAAALKGIVPHAQAMPAYHARDAQTAWDALVDRCEADAGCRAAYPALDRDLRSVLERLEQSPAVLAVEDADGAPVKLRLTRGLFGEALRNFLYTPEGLAEAPRVVRRAAAGDYGPIAQAAYRTRTVVAGAALTAGFFLSVTCAEDVPFVPRAERAALTAGTFGGDYRWRQQEAACAHWPAAPVPADRTQPYRTDVPIVIFSGALDPVTSPAWGEVALPHLSRGRHVVIPHNGHPLGPFAPCAGRIMAQLFDRASVDALDVSCAAALAPVPFALPSREEP